MKVCTPHKNIWCKDEIYDLGFLQDAHAYYTAFFKASSHARHHIFITAWEMESKVSLGRVSSFFPSDLRRYLSSLVRSNEALRIKVLCWKPGPYLKFSRERFSEWKWKKKVHSKVNYQNDKSPYAFGSFHEKLVLIDNSCGFIGGMDISVHRWDTPDHEVDNHLRVDHKGSPYLPVHDAQFMFRGPLLEKMRIMMQARIDKKNIRIDNPNEHSIPLDLSVPTLTKGEASLSRTDPGLNAYEIENLYIDAINTASKYIYIENQYLTFMPIAEALAKRLMEPLGPEVIIVLPLNYLGSFERAIYVSGRNHFIRVLKDADIHGRLGVYYPSLPNENLKKYLKVHSKIMIIDNTFITLGSANLNYRSMRVDREMNLNIESSSIEETLFIKDIFRILLSEHLGCHKDQLNVEGDILKSINSVKGLYQRTLKDLDFGSLSLTERLMDSIGPFVDMRWPIPRTLFWSLVIIIMSFFFYSMKTAYEIL